MPSIIFGQQELRNKLILIEDLDGADEVLYPLREIKSKKRITKTVVVKEYKRRNQNREFSSRRASKCSGLYH